MASKYQLIIEAIIKNDDTQKKIFQDALNEIAKKLKLSLDKDNLNITPDFMKKLNDALKATLTITKVTFDQKALDGVRTQIENAIQGLNLSINANVKTPASPPSPAPTSPVPGAPAPTPGTPATGGITGLEHAVDVMMDGAKAADEFYTEVADLQNLLNKGFKVTEIKNLYGKDDQGEQAVSGRIVDLEKLENGVKRTAHAYLSLDEAGEEVMETLRTGAKAVKSMDQTTDAWANDLRELKLTYADAFQNQAVITDTNKLQDTITKFRSNKASVEDVKAAFDNLKTSIREVNDIAEKDKRLSNWENQLGRLALDNREAFDTTDIKNQVQAIDGLMQEYDKFGTGAQQIDQAFQQLKMSVDEFKQNLKIDDQVATWNQKLTMLQIRNENAFKTDKVKQQLAVVNQTVDAFGKQQETVANVEKEYNKLNNMVTQYRIQQTLANRQADSFGQYLEKAVQKILIWGVGTTIVYGFKRQIEEMVQYVIQLNKELTNIQIVTGMGANGIKNLAKEFNLLAQELGATTLEVAKGSLEWFRQGKTVEETSKLMRSTMMMSKLGNMESAQATEYLTSILNGFKLEAEDAITVVDKLTAVDNAYATSVAEVADALQRSSNSAQQAGVSFDELVSYITVVSSVTRKSSETIGESFKTIFARMQNIKLGKAFEDDATTINDVEKALAGIGIRLRDTEDTFRPMGDVLDEVASKWADLTSIEQSAIAVAIAGIRQRENFLTLMSNYPKVLEAQEISLNSAGLAAQRYTIYMDNIEAATNRFKASWESLATTVAESDFLIYAVNLGTEILKLIEELDALNIAFSALAATLVTKFLIMPALIKWLTGMGKAIMALGAEAWAGKFAIQGLTISVAQLQAVTGVIVFAAFVAGIWALGKAADYARRRMSTLHETMSEKASDFASRQEELEGLKNRYKQLAEQSSLTRDEMLELANITSTLRTKYDLVSEGADMYTDAVQHNTEAINDNVKAIEAKSLAEAQAFLELNKSAAQEAKRFLETPTKYLVGNMAGTGYKLEGTPEEILEQLRERAGEEKDINGIMHKRYELYLAEINAAEDLVNQVKVYQDYVKSLSKSAMIDDHKLWILEKSSKAYEDESEKVLDFKQIMDGLSSTISSSLSIYKEWMDTQELSTEQILNIMQTRADWQELLTVENGKIVLNTAALKENAIAKINDAISTLQATGADKGYTAEIYQQIHALEALRTQLIMDFNDIRVARLAEEREIAENRAKEIAAKAKEIQEEAYQDLLKMTIEMLKQKKQAEIDALNAQLDAYKDIIDAQKQSLRLMEKEHDYQREKEKKEKSIADLMNEIAELQFDTSAEGVAKRLELEAQLAEEKANLEEDEHDHSVESQEDALDQELKNYEDYINSQVDALEEYLKQEGAITQEAIALLQSKSDEFYQSLIEWNRQFGTGIDEDVVGAWNRAFNAAVAYALAVKEIGAGNIPSLSPYTLPPGSDQGDLTGKTIELNNPTGNTVTGYTTSMGKVPETTELPENRKFKVIGYDQGATAPYHIKGTYYEGGTPINVDTWVKSRDVLFEAYHSGLEKGLVGGQSSQYGEIMARLLKGELVMNPSQMKDYVTKYFPRSVEMVASGLGGGLSVGGNLLHIEVTGGVLDQSVVPSIETIAQGVVDRINKAFRQKGNFRPATQFSL